MVGVEADSGAVDSGDSGKPENFFARSLIHLTHAAAIEKKKTSRDFGQRHSSRENLCLTGKRRTVQILAKTLFFALRHLAPATTFGSRQRESCAR
jgi:hypothetical protein